MFFKCTIKFTTSKTLGCICRFGRPGGPSLQVLASELREARAYGGSQGRLRGPASLSSTAVGFPFCPCRVFFQ